MSFNIQRSLLVAMLFATTLLGQFASNVQGVITDASGGTVPGATVTLRNTETGVQNKIQTDRNGSYRFSSVVAGRYVVGVEASGFERTETPFDLGPQETQGINVVLPLGRSATSVTVTERPVGVNVDETRQVTTLSGAQIPDLPLPQRGTLYLVRLAPGAVTIDPSQQLSNTPIGPVQPAVVANGRPAGSNLYRLDGIPIMSVGQNGFINIVPQPDMIQETALQTATFNAEVGAASSIVTDFTSKSGLNSFHGDLDGTYSSRYFQQHIWGSGSSTPYTQKWLMGGFGGPIIKNRTFFFGSAETQFQQTGSSGGAGRYESNEFQNWANTALPNSNFIHTYTNNRPSREQFTGVAAYARDIFPASNATLGTNGQPMGRACGTASTNFMPCDMPVIDNGNFVQSPKLNGTQYNVRLDQYLRGGRDRVFVNYFRVDQVSDFLSNRPNFDSTTPSTTEFTSANWVHTFTGNLINQAQFGWNRAHAIFSSPNPVWVDSAFLFLDFGFADGDKLGFYGIFPGDSNPGGSSSKDHSYRFRDYVSVVKGSHSLRVGLDATHADYWNDQSAFYARPFTATFNSFWDLINDNTSGYSLYTISAQTGKYIAQTFGAQVTQFGLYAQDEWKLRPGLLLSLGFRWDDMGNPYAYGDHTQPFVGVYPGANDVSSNANLRNALVSTSYTGFTQNAFGGRMNNNYQPRLGLAWSPTKDQKTLVRIGFGLYNDGLDLPSVTSNLPTQSPNRLTLTFPNANLPPPGKLPYGTSPLYPYGFDYPIVTPGGFDARGAALSAITGKIIPSDLNGVYKDLTAQRTGLWNIGLQRELPGRVIAEVAYTGSYSWNLFETINYNIAPGSQGNTLTTEWGKIKFVRNGMTSNYHAMVINAHQAIGKVNWTASYTWSHAITDQFVPGSAEQANIYHSTAPFDVRQHFSFGGTYEFPSPRQLLLKETIGGWSVGTIVIAQTGTPFTVLSANNFLNDGESCAPCGIPNIAAGVQTSGFSRQQYEQGIFGAAVSGGATANASQAALFPNPTTTNSQGNEGLNVFRNPGYFGWDASATKRVVLPWFGEAHSTLLFRVEALNVLNRTNLKGVNNATLTNAFFAQSTLGNLPRTIQLGARFEF